MKLRGMFKIWGDIEDRVKKWEQEPDSVDNTFIIDTVYEIANQGCCFIYMDFLSATKDVWGHNASEFDKIYRENL